ncbi:MAG: NAD-dependent epimerase/dehydratase family protein [Pseudomonadales bacterium]|nr:NAD-dependent epimerase/dehydratase family protein [Pseudomonadales bacterium]
MPAVTSSDGPVAVTGASGYIGSHVVISLLTRGYNVRACITDPDNPDKTEHLLALNNADYSGNVELHTANLLDNGSYDRPFADCSAILHVGTAMGYGGANDPRQVYEGAVNGTSNVLASVRKAGTVKRFIYTSSFAAIGHPAPPGYVYTENDWASDDRDNDPDWNLDNLEEKGETGYAMAKVETEHMVNRIAEEDGRFESISVCPIVVLGPLLSKVHELIGSWQWFLGRMLAGKPCQRGWQALWNIVDVRDVAESQVLMIESAVCKNGDRYQLSATDASGEIDCMQLQAHLLQLFPHIDVGGAPDELAPMLEKYGKVYDAPRAHCDKARADLGLQTHAIEGTLRETGQTMMDLGLVTAKLK